MVIALVIGCGGESDDQSALQQKMEEKTIEYAEQDAIDAAEDAAQEASQELVNFKCIIADMQTIYFLKGDAKIVSTMSEGWLIDDQYYMKAEINEDEYLVVYPGEESGMNYDSMMTAYRVSKTTDGYECWLDVVTEDDVTLPDLEQITPDEMGDLMLGAMADEYGLDMGEFQ